MYSMLVPFVLKIYLKLTDIKDSVLLVLHTWTSLDNFEEFTAYCE